MTDQEALAAFDAAYATYTTANNMPIPRTAAQYFFWSGSEFGIESTARIYRDTYQRDKDTEIEGVAI